MSFSHTQPSYRHAAPCGPWPWINLEDDIKESLEAPGDPHICPHPAGQCVGCWKLYPQSLFPNWTSAQVGRSKMKLIANKSERCVIYRIDVTNEAKFSDPGCQRAQEDADFWKMLQDSRPADNVRLQALFIENISAPVLQMLGTRYEVEPFFWTSSVNKIPSRYQEDFHSKKGFDRSDHITITLSFPRVILRQDNINQPTTFQSNNEVLRSGIALDEVIDTHGPLPLRSASGGTNLIIQDHLAMHMIRAADSSTIISYQPDSYLTQTTAKNLHDRVYLAGQSVYWNKLFRASNDSTFVLLTMLWYALYAWDEALEMLWEHICQLESNALNLRKIEVTRELHIIRAHLFHYATLLEDFCLSVKFVRDTPNPAMESDLKREISRDLLQRECDHLLIQIRRLSVSREFWDHRLENIMVLAFSSISIEDSRQMKILSVAAMRDSAAMKQVAYLTMMFLPSSFVSGVFSMNVKEINPQSYQTAAHYVETMIPLMLGSLWFVVAMQGKWDKQDEQGNTLRAPWWARLLWPIIYFGSWIKTREQNQQDTVRKGLPQWNGGPTEVR